MIILAEIRGAWRNLRNQARHSLLLTALLGLGIGASTAVYSVLQATLLGGLTYEDPDRLVQVWTQQANDERALTVTGFTALEAFRSQTTTLESISAIRPETAVTTSFGEPMEMEILRASDSLLDTLGLSVASGRDFIPADGTSAAEPVALVSAALCRERFTVDGKCSAVGRRLMLDDVAYEIVGVLPERQLFPGIHYRESPIHAWIPLIMRPAERPATIQRLRVVARLAGSASLTSARADLNAAVARLRIQDPQVFSGIEARVQTLSESLMGGLRAPLTVTAIAALLLLVAATVNAISLMVARHIGSMTERAIRTALGASPRALLRHDLVESALIGLAGLAAGVLFAQLAIMGFRTAGGVALGMNVDLRLDGATLAFASVLMLVIILATTVVIGRVTGRLPLAPYLKDAGKGAMGGSSRSVALPTIVAIEFGAALAILVFGAAIYAQLQRLQAIPLGFEARSAWVAVLALPAARYPDQPAQIRFLEKVESEVATSPGVESVGIVSRAPMIAPFPTVNFVPFDDPPPPGQAPLANYRAITPTYLQTIGVPLVEGRFFAASDNLQGGDVVVVNEGLARARWPGRSALGQRISFPGEPDRARTIVGVVGDAHLTSLDEAPDHVTYVPLAQNTWPNQLATGVVAFRSPLGQAQLEAVTRDALRRVDANLPAPRLRSLEEAARGSVAKRRFLSTLIFSFAVIAALIAACGVFGAFDYMAARRTRELAIRQAIGATKRRILGETLVQASRPLAVGLVLAGVLTYALLGVGRSYLLDWASTDTGVTLSAALLLLVIALFASWLPVRSVLRRSLALQMRE